MDWYKYFTASLLKSRTKMNNLNGHTSGDSELHEIAIGSRYHEKRKIFLVPERNIVLTCTATYIFHIFEQRGVPFFEGRGYFSCADMQSFDTVCWFLKCVFCIFDSTYFSNEEVIVKKISSLFLII